MKRIQSTSGGIKFILNKVSVLGTAAFIYQLGDMGKSRIKVYKSIRFKIGGSRNPIV